MLRTAVVEELRELWSLPRILFYAIIFFYPIVYGLVRLRSAAYRAPIETFGEMIGGPAALVFPLVLATVYVFRFSGLLNNRYAFYSRFRRGTRSFLATHAVANAMVVGFLVFASYLMAGCVAFSVLPGSSYLARNAGYLELLPANELSEFTAHALTFSQLTPVGLWLYVIVFAGFVATFSMVIATASLAFTLLLHSRILGLAATLILYQVENFLLAYSGLEQFRTVSALFPAAIVQQPIWVAMVPLAGWILLTAALLRRVWRYADQLESLA